MVIPKTIHYCWFGGKIPVDVKERIENWHNVLQEYEFILWSEDNFDINYCMYARDAYESKKYAFVSDVARLYALNKFGGIYLDTDVDVMRVFDELLLEEGFAGFECSGRVGTCVLGARRGNTIINDFLMEYENKRFVREDGTLDMTPNTLFFYKVFSGGRFKSRKCKAKT